MSFEIPRLRKFLGCFSVETGSSIIAWLFMMGSSMQLVTTVILYNNVLDYVEQQISNYTDLTPEKQDADMKILLAKVIVNLIIAALGFGVAINLLLLIGIYKRNIGLMLPWILLVGAGCVLGFISGIQALITSMYSLDTFVLYFTYITFSLAIQVYVFLTVYSFYDELKAMRNVNERTPLSKAGISNQNYQILS